MEALPQIPRRAPRALVELLRDAGLTRDFIRRMTEPGDDLRSPLAPTREAQYNDDPAFALLRLFFCRQTITTEILEPRARKILQETEFLLQPDDGHLVSPFHLRLVRGLYLFSDYLGEQSDAVMGAGETTAVLFQAGTPTNPIQRALDLGCGAGTLALLLANQADQVVGTDINPRAVALAQFNAAINGVTNASFRCGDTFEPVSNERFDLILSQPPYYPSPSSQDSNLTYLHGGPRGDELALRIVGQIPAHLSPTGRALVFTSWPRDRQDISLEGMEVLELTTNRREIHGTRQSINVIQRAKTGTGWYGTFEVPADHWGNVKSGRVDELFAANRLLQQSDDQVRAAKLRLTEGITFFHEGSNLLLRGPAESLIGYTPIQEEIREVLTGSKSLLPALKDALRRGFLTVG